MDFTLRKQYKQYLMVSPFRHHAGGWCWFIAGEIHERLRECDSNYYHYLDLQRPGIYCTV